MQEKIGADTDVLQEARVPPDESAMVTMMTKDIVRKTKETMVGTLII